DCDLALAARMAERGDLTGAIAAYEALGDYGDAAGQAQALRYRLGQQHAEAGELAEAIGVFEALGDYGDAATQA
ncbi:hypothetical protein QIG69_27950, partial [Klebsiella pneumoniae]|nr:hypothetical protein [Klebsiella pneumoniae]